MRKSGTETLAYIFPSSSVLSTMVRQQKKFDPTGMVGYKDHTM